MRHLSSDSDKISVFRRKTTCHNSVTDPTFRIKKFLYGFSEVIESDLQYDAPEVNESVTSL